MTFLSPESVIQALSWRYAVKQFDASKSIPSATWAAIEDALVLSASSFGLQPWKFIVVKSKSLRESLLPVSWNQSQIVNASEMVVFAIKKDLSAADIENYIALISEVRGVPASTLDQYAGMMKGMLLQPSFDINAWATNQVYLAIGSSLTTAALLGVDACPMEGIDKTQYDTILNLDDYATKCVVTFGYRSEDDKYAHAKKVRWPKNRVLSHV